KQDLRGRTQTACGGRRPESAIVVGGILGSFGVDVRGAAAFAAAKRPLSAALAGPTAKQRGVGRAGGGEGGIRTHGGREPTAVFKTAALNHSATSPARGT